MFENGIEKWVVTKSRGENFYFIIKEVCVNKEDYLDESKFNARCYFKDDDDKKVVILEKKGLYDKDVANIKKKERQITKEFKDKNRKDDGTWVCSCCGKTIFNKEDCTIDHIKPKSSFRNIYGEIEKEDWYLCWSKSNLQILCFKCNQRKRSMSIKKNKDLTRKSNKIRKKARKSRGKLKHKVRFGIKCKDDNAYELARRDSNYIDVKSFFYKDKYKK